MSARNLAVAVALVAVLATGCGTSDDREPPSPKAVVEVGDRGYEPREIEVPVGGRVTWVNVSPEDQHTVQSANVPEFVYDLRILDAQNRFDTHTLQPGEAQSVEFDTPGRYKYFSSFDPEFEGVVEVVADR